MQSFNIKFPASIIWFNICIFVLCLGSISFWQAPLLYRLILIGLISLFGLWHYWHFNKIYRQYPYRLSLKSTGWHLGERAVNILASSTLGAYFTTLHLRDLRGKRTTLLITKASFQNTEEYFRLIRFLRIHQASA